MMAKEDLAETDAGGRSQRQTWSGKGTKETTGGEATALESSNSEKGRGQRKRLPMLLRLLHEEMRGHQSCLWIALLFLSMSVNLASSQVRVASRATYFDSESVGE